MYIPDRADLDPINPWRKGFTIQLWMFRGQCARWGHRWRPFLRRLQSYSVALLLNIKPAMFHMKSSEQRPWLFVTFCWLHQQLSSRGHSGGGYSSVVEHHHQTPPRFSSCHRNCNLPGAMRTAEVTNRYSQSGSWLMSDWGDRANDWHFHTLQAPPTTGLLKGLERWFQRLPNKQENLCSSIPQWHSDANAGKEETEGPLGFSGQPTELNQWVPGWVKGIVLKNKATEEITWHQPPSTHACVCAYTNTHTHDSIFIWD